jgi:metal-responsive CopG/Arc/MetJ family transcriptional regulator
LALARTNVTIPEDLLDQVDELAGPRGRSAFVADAVAAKVKRERLRRALEETRGVMVGSAGWMSPEETYRWVREQREIGNDPGRVL